MGSPQICLSTGLTWQRMDGENTLVFLSGSLIRKEIFEHFGSSSITRGEPTLGGARHAIHSLSFTQAAPGPHGCSLHHRGAEAPDELCSRNGSGCIWSQPIKQINEQFEQGLLAPLPHTFGQGLCSSGSQKPRRPEWRRRWQEKERPRGRYPAELMMRWVFCKRKRKGEREENIRCTSIPRSPFGSGHTHYGWNHEVFMGLEWPEHSAGDNLLQNGEPGECHLSFSLLGLHFFLQSPRRKTNRWQSIPFSGNNSVWPPLPTHGLFLWGPKMGDANSRMKSSPIL